MEGPPQHDEALPRPEGGTSVERFLCEYLPRLTAALLGYERPPARPHPLVLVVGGDPFTLTLGPGGLTVAAHQVASEAAVHVTCSAADFRTLVRDLLPRLLRHADEHVAAARRSFAHLAQASLPGINPAGLHDKPGRVELTYTDDAGDSLQLLATIGTGHGPHVRVRLDDTELWDFLNSGLNWSALLRGRLRLEGDVEYLMRLAALRAT